MTTDPSTTPLPERDDDNKISENIMEELTGKNNLVSPDLPNDAGKLAGVKNPG